MNKHGDSMDKFGVPIVDRYINGDRYAVSDVEDIFYNLGVASYGKKRKIENLKICSYLFFYTKLL
jgi:hypothetical protein